MLALVLEIICLQSVDQARVPLCRFCVCFVFSLQVPYKLPELEETGHLQDQPYCYLDEDLTPGTGSDLKIILLYVAQAG